MFKKILIANRGEIAVRVIRACREMGITSVAVFSEVDRKALHVRLADEAYLIGPPPANQSYLVMEKIIQTAKKSGAEAIHPGYGFLAENPEFVEMIEKEGLIFIGPPAKAVRLLGDKMEARKTMLSSGVPVVPGAKEKIESEEQAISFAQSIGFPVLIKAAAGGGGKGMRLVKNQEEMKQAIRGASSEAQSAFADSRIYIEKYLEKPRHIEIQILADKFGEVVYLGERECSIQRRHQKVIEESPSPLVDEKMRKEMGETAVKAAKAAGYVNAGTVEFLVDPQKNFYFLEVNTRLQVEHPVTELVTGIDIVKEQIKIATGEKLSFVQKDIHWKGWAIECRIYAEDPENNFLPSIGTIESYLEPAGPGVRVDSGLYEGGEVSLYYDPIVAKLITWGKDREEAIQRMKRALTEYRITGVTTTIPLHSQVMENEKFLKGEISTHFIEEEFKKQELISKDGDQEEYKLVAIVSALVDFQERRKEQVSLLGGKKFADSPWKTEGRKRGLR
jgi:acetyl-CoA carboxylase biotin carboxylase subunit